MRGRRYSSEEDAWLREHYKRILIRDLTAEFNRHFGLDLTESQIKGYLNNHKIRSGFGSSKKGLRYKWTEEADQILAEYKDLPNSEISEIIRNTLGLDLNEGAVSHRKSRLGLHSVFDGRFEKGHKPTNGYEKGHRPASWCPIGTEVIRDGFTYVKVKDEPYGYQYDNWRRKHVAIWEEANGPVPEGYMVIFLNGDRSDFRLENLALISMGENATLTKLGLRFEDEQFTSLGIQIVRLKKATRRREK